MLKYPVVLWGPGWVLGGWLGRREREESPGLRRGLWWGVLVAGVVASLGLAPVVWWNATHGWITVRHLLGHLGVEGGDVGRAAGEGWTPLWVLELLGMQVALAGPALLLGVYGVVCARRGYLGAVGDARLGRGGGGPECPAPEEEGGGGGRSWEKAAEKEEKKEKKEPSPQPSPAGGGRGGRKGEKEEKKEEKKEEEKGGEGGKGGPEWPAPEGVAEAIATWREVRYLVCCGLPVLVFYVLVSLVAEPEGNWPIAAWVSAAPLGAIAVAGVMPEYRRRVAAWRAAGGGGIRPHMHRVMAWRWTVGLGVIVALGFARADWLAGLPVVGPLVPRGRLMDADVRAADAARILGELRAETGLEPVVMAQHYGRTSQLAYYLPGRPVVYCAGAYMEGPRKQYDLWPETDLSNAATHARLSGRPSLLVGGRFEQWVPAFERVVEAGQLEGEHKQGRVIYLGYGYGGFGKDEGGRMKDEE